MRKEFKNQKTRVCQNSVIILVLFVTLLFGSINAFAASSETRGVSKVVDHGFGITDRYYNSTQCYNMATEYAKQASNKLGGNIVVSVGKFTYAKYNWALGNASKFNLVGAVGSIANFVDVPLLKWYSDRCYEGSKGNGLIFKCHSLWIPYEISNQ